MLMRQWLGQVLAMAGNAGRVMLGDPSTLILHLYLVVGTGVLACLPAFAFSEHLRLLRDQALAQAFIGGALAATLGAAKAVGEEGRGGMTPLIMSRPVTAGAFLFGKWLGIAGTLLFLSASAAVAYLWASRIAHFNHHVESLGLWALAGAVVLPLAGAGALHYRRRGCFVRQANLALAGTLLAVFLGLGFLGYDGGMPEQYGALSDWPTAVAFLYLALALASYSALLAALAVGADLSLLMAISAAVFFLGLLAEHLLRAFVPVPAIAGLLRVFLPNWQLFWIAEHLADFGLPPPHHLLACAIHALGQATLFLLAGQWWLRRRELTGGI